MGDGGGETAAFYFNLIKQIESLQEQNAKLRKKNSELEKQNTELVEALRCFLALETPHTWLYKRNKAEALVKESLSTELFNELQSNRG